MSLKRVVLIAALALLVAPSAALADGIDFGLTGGTVVSTGVVISNDPLLGGVASTLTAVARIPSPPGATFTGVLGTVTFTTGAFTGVAFAPGGSILITNSALPAGPILFSGVFTSPLLITFLSPTSFSLSGSVGGGVGALDPGLLALLGFPTLTTSGSGFIITLIVDFAGASGSVSSGNIFVTPVPEPGTLALFGTGLIGLAGLVRRKLAA